MAGSDEGMQDLENNISSTITTHSTSNESTTTNQEKGKEIDTTTTNPEKNIGVFSGVIDTEEVRGMMASDPFIKQTVDSFLKYSEPEKKEDSQNQNDTNQGSTIAHAKHTKTP